MSSWLPAAISTARVMLRVRLPPFLPVNVTASFRPYSASNLVQPPRRPVEASASAPMPAHLIKFLREILQDIGCPPSLFYTPALRHTSHHGLILSQRGAACQSKPRIFHLLRPFFKPPAGGEA